MKRKGHVWTEADLTGLQRLKPSHVASPRRSPPESAFMAQVRRLAMHQNWLEYHTHNSRRSTPGFPDLVLVRNSSAVGGSPLSRVIFAELKTETGKVTPAQQLWLEALRQCPGVEVYLWRPHDWDVIVATLQRPRPGRD